MILAWNPKHPVLNGCLLISNHFPSEGLVYHPIERTKKRYVFHFSPFLSKAPQKNTSRSFGFYSTTETGCGSLKRIRRFNGATKMMATQKQEQLHPGRLTWNLRIHPWKRKIIFETTIFRFYVNIWGCTVFEK